MIKAISVINSHKEKIRFELSNPSTTNILVTKVEGLGPPKATINMLKVATFDGSIFNSSKLEQRNIVITFRPLPSPDVEGRRLLLYRMFPIKGYVTIIVETDHRTGGIDGYVESNEPDIFNSGETIQVSVVCPDPYFKAYEGNKEQEIISSPSFRNPLFEFPFENNSLELDLLEMGEAIPSGDTLINYIGDNISYPVFRFTFTEDVSVSGKLLVIEKTVPYLPDYVQRLAIDLSKCKGDFVDGDILEVDCRPRHKSVKVSKLIGSTLTYREVYGAVPFTATVGGVTFNNEWLSLEYGESSFSMKIANPSSSTNVWSDWIDTVSEEGIRFFATTDWSNTQLYMKFDIEFRTIGSSSEYWSMFISDNTDPTDSSLARYSFSKIMEVLNAKMNELYGGSNAVQPYAYDGHSTYKFSPKILEGLVIHIEANTTTSSFSGQVGSSIGLKRIGSGDYQYRVKGIQVSHSPIATIDAKDSENELPFNLTVSYQTMYEGM